MGSTKSSGVTAEAGKKPIHDLCELLDRVELLCQENNEICLEDIVGIIGTRWFGPLLVVPGLVMVVPGLGDIPGTSLLMGFVVLLISVQAIFDRRSKVWLPNWLAQRAVKQSTVKSGLKWVRKPAGLLDSLTRRRLTWAVKHSSFYVIAATCTLLAGTAPLLEIVPFSAMIAGTAITCFGLALLAQDGLIALLAIAFSLGTLGLIVVKFVL